MRDAMLNRVDEGRLEKITQAKKRHHELMSALQTAKEGAEEKARRTQERVRALQVLVFCARSCASAERRRYMLHTSHFVVSFSSFLHPHLNNISV